MRRDNGNVKGEDEVENEVEDEDEGEVRGEGGQDKGQVSLWYDKYDIAKYYAPSCCEGQDQGIRVSGY